MAQLLGQGLKTLLCFRRKRLWGLPCPHVWPFQEFVETERACYLIRQYVFSNLYDRLSMRPFLAPIEKVGCLQR